MSVHVQAAHGERYDAETSSFLTILALTLSGCLASEKGLGLLERYGRAAGRLALACEPGPWYCCSMVEAGCAPARAS
ncbi:MAG: hypothetical protein QXV79_04440 [Thermofilaceae archaeon]